MKMMGTDIGEATKALAKRIAEKEPDPIRWMVEVRKAAEELKLNVACAIVLGQTLEATCYALVDEAAKRGRTVADVAAAVKVRDELQCCTRASADNEDTVACPHPGCTTLHRALNVIYGWATFENGVLIKCPGCGRPVRLQRYVVTRYTATTE